MIFFSLIEQYMVHIPLFIGSYISFSLLKIPNLSIESACTFGAYCAAFIVPYIAHFHPFLQLLCILTVSFISGGVVGLLSAGVSIFLKISHLFAAIITSGIMYGIHQLLLGSYHSMSSIQNFLILPFIESHPEVVSITTISICIISFFYWLLKTQVGFSLAAYGLNNSFFKHYGLSSSYVLIIGTAIANGLAGITGYLQAQTNGFVEITMSSNKSLLCLIALIFGKVIIRGDAIGHIGHPIVGGFIYFFIQYLLVTTEFDSKFFSLFQALIICVILGARAQKGAYAQKNIVGI